jgi:hypothetical protein
MVLPARLLPTTLVPSLVSNALTGCYFLKWKDYAAFNYDKSCQPPFCLLLINFFSAFDNYSGGIASQMH